MQFQPTVFNVYLLIFMNYRFTLYFGDVSWTYWHGSYGWFSSNIYMHHHRQSRAMFPLEIQSYWVKWVRRSIFRRLVGSRVQVQRYVQQ